MWTVKFITLKVALAESGKVLLLMSIQVFISQKRQAQDGSKLAFQEADRIHPLKRVISTLIKQ